MEKKDLLKYCLLYKGQANIEDNPLNKDNDEFKWHMWRSEFVVVHLAIEENVKADKFEEYFKGSIRALIDVFACAPFGGDPIPYYEKYLGYE